ncbi:MFS transporter [Rapidithrix thailandica]|uniref:MFS transporter n=1 Tax=Rapidithrix thailandica TaxID=413964 RepID=A0AAW9RWL3_9BACT
MSTAKPIKHHRIAVGAVFFLYGMCFASWAARIPSIQQKLQLTDAALGGVLFALPVGAFVALPIAGWMVAKTGSRWVVMISSLLYGSILVGIGYSASVAQLTVALFGFGMLGNMLNIAVNTQAVGVEAVYQKNIMASFHGMWSLAGFGGAALGTLMIGIEVIPAHHYILVWILTILLLLVSFRFLLIRDTDTDGDKPLFSWPDKSLLIYGVIAFCSMMCEGAMFDWSGVYFKKVLQVDKALIGVGYTAFMITMAGTRFVADGLTQRFGLRRILQFSGLLTALGLLLSVIFPSFITATIGFLLVGIGVSSVVPLVFSAAGKSKTMSPGIALASVSSLGFLGFLIGPPLIGFIAEVSNLRTSFLFIAFMGICVVYFSTTKVKE